MLLRAQASQGRAVTELENLVEKAESQIQFSGGSSTEPQETFDVLSLSRLPDVITLFLLGGGLIGLMVALANNEAQPLAWAALLACIAYGFFLRDLVIRMGSSFTLKGSRLTYRRRGVERSFDLTGATVDVSGLFTKSDGDFSSVNLVTSEGVRKIPLPDRIIKGDLVRERFIAALAAGGADILLPGYLLPTGGVNEVDEVKVAGSEAGLGCAGAAIGMTFLSMLVLAGRSGMVFGLTASLLLLVILVPILAAIIYNATQVRMKGRLIQFHPDKLICLRGKEVEWEVPREMLQGILVESRKLPFRNTEVRVVAKTLYQRSLVLMDWTSGRSETRPFLLAHARARGIPVEIKRGGEEPGSSSMAG